jgi:hypothetical protein
MPVTRAFTVLPDEKLHSNEVRSSVLLPLATPGAHEARNHAWRLAMSLGTILLIVIILALLGVIPTWPHSRGWGYGPSGGIGVVLLILIVLLLSGRI